MHKCPRLVSAWCLVRNWLLQQIFSRFVVKKINSWPQNKIRFYCSQNIFVPMNFICFKGLHKVTHTSLCKTRGPQANIAHLSYTSHNKISFMEPYTKYLDNEVEEILYKQIKRFSKCSHYILMLSIEPLFKRVISQPYHTLSKSSNNCSYIYKPISDFETLWAPVIVMGPQS